MCVNRLILELTIFKWDKKHNENEDVHYSSVHITSLKYYSDLNKWIHLIIEILQ